MKQIEVVAAIISHDNKILCMQRAVNKYDYISLKYEFPGGKIEEGETQQDALKREIREELNMDIVVQDFFLTVNHEYPDFKLVMHSFLCNCSNTELVLNEHVAYRWLTKGNLLELDWAAADVPIVQKIISG